MGERILRASVAVAVAHACLKICGVLQHNIVPNAYGGVVSDVFIVVSTSILGVLFNFGEQCIGPAFLPVFSNAREKGGEQQAWNYTSVLFNIQLVILVIVMAALVFFPGAVISAFTQWDAANPKFTERRELAEKMLPLVAPALLGMSLASLTYMLLNGYKEFFFAAFGDSVLKLSIFAGALIGAKIGKPVEGELADWRFVAAGALIGGFAKLATHLFALGFKRLRQYRFTLKLSDEHVKMFWLLVLPLLAGIIISSYRDVVMNNVLTANLMIPTYFRQGRTIVDSIGFLVPYSISIALLPYFCDLAARNDNRQLGELLTKTIRMLVWAFVPVCVVLVIAANPICFVLFSGKTISASDIPLPALVLQLYALQLPFSAIEMMVMQAYFSNRRMIAPTVVGLGFSLLSAAVAYWIVIVNGETDGRTILLTVSLSLILAKIVKSIVLVIMLKSTVPILPFGETLGFTVKLMITGGASALAAFACAAATRGLLESVTRNARAQQLALAGIIALVGGAVFLIGSFALRMNEPRECLQWAKAKLNRRGTKAAQADLPTGT